MIRNIIFLLLVVFFAGCTRNNDPSKIKVVAKAGDEELDLDEYLSMFVSTGFIKDSAYNAKKAIDAWAIEALFYQEAISKLNSDEILIERQVQDYRKSLVNFIYQTKIVEANLDTVISNEEVESYYNEHRDNFILRDNIVKVNFLKVPLQAPGLVKIKKLIWSVNPKDRIQLLELCGQNAESFFMNDSTWLFLDNIKKEIPALKEQDDLNLSTGRVFEFQDEEYYYYLKVKDVKVKNGLSPINFERQNIKKFIINNRKTQLIKQYKQILLEKAETSKNYKRF